MKLTEEQQAYLDGHCDGYARGYLDGIEEGRRQWPKQPAITGHVAYETKTEEQQCEREVKSTSSPS